MPYRLRVCTCLFAAAALLGGSIGCATSSHKSVRIEEYNEEPPRDRQMDDELDSEYKMVSPGEMVGPGETVDD